MLSVAALLGLVACGAIAQVPGLPAEPAPAPPKPEATIPVDTLFIFEPARPLIDSVATADHYDDALGFDILFSNSGFGLGGFYQRPIGRRSAAFINVGITGSRKSDEFPRLIRNPDNESPTRYIYDVEGKVNRVYTIPLTIGYRYRILDQVLVDNFRPYLNVGGGPSLIIALPYEHDFFTSLGHASAYFTAGAFVGIGAEFGNGQPLLGVNVRYYYIPFAPGVESIEDDPITQFGGLFLTMNVGFLR